MKPRVYIETTIPSFYHETRTEPEIVVRRKWTREWWDEESGSCRTCDESGRCRGTFAR